MNSDVVTLPRLGSGSLGREETRLDVEIWGQRLLSAIVLIWAASFVVGFQVALALLTGLGYALAIIGMARPTIGLLGIGMLCTLNPISQGFLATGGLFRWNTLNYWLVIVTTLGAPLLLRCNHLLLRLLQGFVLLLALGLLISPDPTAGGLTILGTIAQFGLLVYFLRVGLNDRVWYWLALVNGVLAAAGGFVYYLQYDQQLYLDPNVFSRFPVTACFSICLAQCVSVGWSRGNITLWLLVLVNCLWVFLSGSRGNMLILACCLLFLMSQIPGFRRRMVFVAASVLLFLVASLQYQSNLEFALGRAQNLLDTEQSLRTRTSGRSELVRGSWRIFLRQPLGVGTGGFASMWMNHDYADITHRRGQRRAAHSGWIKVLAENGIPGIVLLGSFVFAFALSGLQSGRDQKKLFLFGLFVSAVISIAWISAEYHVTSTSFLAAGAIAIFAAVRQNR